MGVALIVSKKHDREFNDTGDSIARERWLDYVERASDLRLRERPHSVRSPQGVAVVVAAGNVESELLIDGRPQPFLRYRSGDLVMGLSFDPDDRDDPVRRRVAAIARHFGALITHDAGDEILDW